jgi:hypothetical protein
MRNLLKPIIGAFALAVAAPVMPHHSFSAEFSVGRPLEFTGTITRVEWTNPHAWLFLVIEDEAGNAEDWAVELLGVTALMRRGLRPDAIKPGDRLVIEGFGARDGSNAANASKVTRADTDEVLWISAAGDRTQ